MNNIDFFYFNKNLHWYTTSSQETQLGILSNSTMVRIAPNFYSLIIEEPKDILSSLEHPPKNYLLQDRLNQYETRLLLTLAQTFKDPLNQDYLFHSTRFAPYSETFSFVENSQEYPYLKSMGFTLSQFNPQQLNFQKEFVMPHEKSKHHLVEQIKQVYDKSAKIIPKKKIQKYLSNQGALFLKYYAEEKFQSQT